MAKRQNNVKLVDIQFLSSWTVYHHSGASFVNKPDEIEARESNPRNDIKNLNWASGTGKYLKKGLHDC